MRTADDPDLPNPSTGDGDSETVGEYVEVEPEDGEYQTVVDPDGGLTVSIGEEYEPPQSQTGFYENLAEVLEEAGAGSVLDDIASRLMRKIEEDQDARKKRDEQYEEGIRRTGLGKDAPGGAEFEGASRAVHPMLVEACIDFDARIMKELFPPSGPVKENIIGTVTTEKAERAARKVEHMNWQINTQIKEAISTADTMFTQVPLAGRGYIHQRWDHRLMRPRWEFVPSDKAFYPYSATDWHSASRRTISWTISAVEFRHRMDSGVYCDIELGTVGSRPEPTKPQKATDKVEGKDDPGMNLDDDREVYETMEVMEVTEDMGKILDHEEAGGLYPYLLTIDVNSRKVVAMYRDWEEDDKAREPIEHTFEFSFINWRDGNIGFPHIIGSLSGAATGALRALLDSAFISNVPSGGILKGSGVGGQTKRPGIGELTEIEGGLEADDIRKKIMMFNFQGPSPVLFQLLGFIVDAGRSAVRTSLEEMATDTNPNTPVGTTLARMQEGMVVFSSIHARQHRAFNRLLAGLHRLNRLYLPERVSVDANGMEILVYRRDYEGPCDIQPVSDPTIYSDQQRFAQITAIQQRATMVPNLYKPREVEVRFLKLLKIADYEELLQEVPQPTESNAANENVALMLGKPVTAFPEQDHLAHLQVLLDCMKSPALGANPLIAPVFMPAAIKHAVEHIAFFYVATMQRMVSEAAGRAAHELMSSDDEVKQKFDQLLAKASQLLVPHVQQSLAGALPVLQQAAQMMQQMAPKPPADPVAATVAMGQAETARKSALDKGNLTIDQQKVALQAQGLQQKQAQVDSQNQTALQKVSLEGQTALDIASTKIGSGGTNYTDGASLGGG